MWAVLNVVIPFFLIIDRAFTNIAKGKFTIKRTNLSEDIIEILYLANFDVISLLNHLSKMNFFFYGFKYLCTTLSININQFGKF